MFEESARAAQPWRNLGTVLAQLWFITIFFFNLMRVFQQVLSYLIVMTFKTSLCHVTPTLCHFAPTYYFALTLYHLPFSIWIMGIILIESVIVCSNKNIVIWNHSLTSNSESSGCHNEYSTVWLKIRLFSEKIGPLGLKIHPLIEKKFKLFC